MNDAQIAKRLIDSGIFGNVSPMDSAESMRQLGVDEVEVGQVVAVKSHGRIRQGLVVKVGRTRVTVATTTPTEVERAREQWGRDAEIRRMTDAMIQERATAEVAQIQDFADNGNASWTQDEVDTRREAWVKQLTARRDVDSWYGYVVVNHNARREFWAAPQAATSMAQAAAHQEPQEAAEVPQAKPAKLTKAERRERNRELAAALVAAGKAKNGETWTRARKVLDAGSSIEEAVKAA